MCIRDSLSRQGDIRQVRAVGVAGVDLLAHVLRDTPQDDRAPGVSEHGGERGPPRAGAQYRSPGPVPAHSAPPSRRMTCRTAGACSPRMSSSRVVIATITRSVASRSTCLLYT